MTCFFDMLNLSYGLRVDFNHCPQHAGKYFDLFTLLLVKMNL